MKYFTCTSLLIAIHILGSQGLNEDCKKNSECENEAAICWNGKCDCDNISYYNKDTQRCLPYATEYNHYCLESDQCVWLGTNSECKGNRCVCTKGFRWFQGKCQKFVDKGSPCTSASECYNGYDMLSLKCSEDHICTCNDGYYDRDGDCRHESPFDGECALDIDCSRNISENLHCELGHCKKSTEESINTVKYSSPTDSASEIYVQDSGSETYENITCSFDDDCRDMANSQCDGSSGTCRCKANTYLFEGNCSPGFEACDGSSGSCSLVANTMCFKDTTCICKPGYFMNNGKCVPELGMSDSSLKDCVIKPGRLVGSTCYCKLYWFNDESNRNCIKTMLQQTKSCVTNEWCNAMGPYTTCNSATGKCQCSSFANLKESSFYCLKVDDPPKEGFCMRDSDCPLNEKCSDEKCECINNFSRYGEESTCLPDVGGSCDITGCSHLENSRCSGVCKCIANYAGTKNKCLEVIDNLDGTCEDDVQCGTIDHAECGPSTAVNKTCICQDRYVDAGNICMQVKEYGDPCMKETDCTLVLNRSFQCRKNKCLCQTKYVLKDGYCTSSSATFSMATLILIFSTLSLQVT